MLKGLFLFHLLLTSCSFRDSKVPQIYTPGELVEHTAAMRLRSGSHGSAQAYLPNSSMHRRQSRTPHWHICRTSTPSKFYDERDFEPASTG